MNTSNIEEIINKEGDFIVTPVGISMWPLLRNRRDTVHVEKYTGNLKKYDLPVYKRDTGKLIMHRCIEIRDDGYVMCGDSQTYKEYGIKDEQIIAVAKGIYKDEKYFPCTNIIYRIWVRMWCMNLFLRRCILFVLKRTKGWKEVYSQVVNTNK